jgi:hypothetical protein
MTEDKIILKLIQESSKYSFHEQQKYLYEKAFEVKIDPVKTASYTKKLLIESFIKEKHPREYYKTGTTCDDYPIVKSDTEIIYELTTKGIIYLNQF